MTKSVRCKFKVDGVEKFNEGGKIQMSAVTHGSDENASFFHYTPSAFLSLQTVNESAIGMFEVGQEYYIDISPASE